MHQIEKEKISKVKIESWSKNTNVILNRNAFTYWHGKIFGTSSNSFIFLEFCCGSMGFKVNPINESIFYSFIENFDYNWNHLMWLLIIVTFSLCDQIGPNFSFPKLSVRYFTYVWE